MDADLARRLAEHPRWRWMPGMRLLDGTDAWRVYGRGNDGAVLTVQVNDGRRRSYATADSCRPDLDDPPTAGCLLRLVREREPFLAVEWDYSGDVRLCDNGRPSSWHVTEPSLGEACAAALMLLWERETNDG